MDNITHPFVVEYFWKRVDKQEGGCWLWTGTIRPDGYGVIYIASKALRFRTSAHRYSYQLIKGAIPEGLELDHLCRVRKCCNPDHLEAVTHAENLRRGVHHHGLLPSTIKRALERLAKAPYKPYKPYVPYTSDCTSEGVADSDR